MKLCQVGMVRPSIQLSTLQMRVGGLQGGRDLTRYRNQPDKSLHQSRAAMHHHPKNQERALNLSILAMS